MTNINTILRQHVTLSTRCIDRLYINGYVPKLQTPGQLCYFLSKHHGQPIASPALLRPMHDRFVDGVSRYATEHGVEIRPFKRGERKDEVVAEYRGKFTADEGAVVIGVAQERATSFKATKRTGPQGGVSFDFSRQTVAVNQYYFYLQDAQWGPAFIKVCTYMPYPVKLCLNGHEWVKQQLRHEGLGFESLDNGFLSCADPERLQQVCDALGAEQVQAFFDHWSTQLPWPLTPLDRAAGFHHQLSVWQLEVSQTDVFERPVQGRQFFEAVIRDNLDLGRPEEVSVLFPQRLTRRTPPPVCGYRSRVITSGVNPSLHAHFKRSHVKQYFKENRALRTETTINDPRDVFVNKSLKQLGHLKDVGQQINRKLLEHERLSHDCVLSTAALDRLQAPTQLGTQRAPALRLGDPRVMALMQALCLMAHVPSGFRHREIRPHVAALWGRDLETYSSSRMSYDLRRLRLKGLISRVGHSQRYTVTTYGLKVALFYSKLHLRLVLPAATAMHAAPSKTPSPLQRAFNQVERQLNRLWDEAQFQPAPVRMA